MTFSLSHFLYLLQGTFWTILLSIFGFLGGGILGLTIALMRVSSVRFLRWIATGYIEVLQGIPLPVLMFLSYFGLGITGFDVPALVAASLSIALNAAAFLGDIWRGCIEAVPKTQWEAADSLTLSPFRRMTDVILPQAVRLAIPPTIGFSVQIIKNTSYAVVIGFIELTQSGKIINNAIFEPFVVFTIVGAIYFLLCSPLSRASRRLEGRLRARGA
ncbi:amino acid ABC transporter permease [Methylovirgula sp. 4M-Z18]|uniref:amino acid ABC transporter permease n=1 Tax=Methylovirgula sp. 4M-Z18 TaxID=2293567 RepID=UPI000E2F59CB|nr:amino acid ABC transporter permease [Methylovirgula sp. 4M-Z18]RFB76712.1 amino acid ABC transporter permease [Methylovirgula sp. 4M-Z18]